MIRSSTNRVLTSETLNLNPLMREENNMTKLTRRGFLGKTSAGAATIGALLVAPGLAEAASGPSPAANLHLTKEELAGPVVVHVRDLATGELALMVGTREIVLHDREFVSRLGKAMRRSPGQTD
jgi:hypothetical protein